MQTVKNIKAIKEIIEAYKASGNVGFVPTMGALHEGHLSLVRESVKENTHTIVSIYVNPTQFNDKSDLERYPRDLDKDFILLESSGCDLIFAPSDFEMYPKPDTRVFDFGTLDKVMEGKHRKGHFNGVGQIVSKLFDIIRPDNAYFGLKDFQQLTIIKKLVKDYHYNINIKPCQIVREKDGLAMSSRNTLLEKEKRMEAPFIYYILTEAAKMVNKFSPLEVKSWVENRFNATEHLDLEYFEIVDNEMLLPVTAFNPGNEYTACIAVHAGKVRLIDNVQIIL